MKSIFNKSRVGNLLRSSKKNLYLLKIKVRYYRSLVIKNKPADSSLKILLNWVKKFLLVLPDWVIYNPLNGFFYKVAYKFFDWIIEKKTQNIIINLDVFEEGVPEYFELKNPPDNPKVSIIIPVHNKFDYTFMCIYSIFKNNPEIDYEIIVADDNSSDETLKIGDKIKNIIVTRNTLGLGFLENCNLAAKEARGEFIVFLNNDTITDQDWLINMVDVFNRNHQAGIVGSKLIYPNRSLQEAGSITFRDGNCWNYGKFSRQDTPDANYLKEVDYVSGASLMIRKSLWIDIGGFDSRFSPAYYEDTDLAFTVRQRGYKVFYQPKSRVIHYEGISHGKDTSSGIKKYQLLNRVKFFEKWKSVLQAEQCANSNDLFVARDRSQNHKIVLFIDYNVPTFDQDAGSRMSFHYLKILLSLEYRVKFIADSTISIEPYTSILQQMGIEVLYGNSFQLEYEDWIKKNGCHFSCVILNRPNVALNHVDLIRKHTDCPIVYFGHDLHYLRNKRKYELLGQKSFLIESERWRKLEFEILSQVDIGFYPSFTEPEEIKNEFALRNTAVLPINAYEKSSGSQLSEYCETKRDLLFVGGFQHDPNVDAVHWFVSDIFPRISSSIPEIKLHVVGSKMPETITKLASDRILIHGFISDAELIKMYDSCRLVVAPLRYGAGVKGKIIEALYFRCPVVTTTIGAEGIENSNALIKIADDINSFADCVISLYKDKAECVRIFDIAPLFISDNYSMEKAKSIIKKYVKN